MPKLDETIAKESPGLFWLSGFNGINVQDDRRAIDDEECFWLENLMPLGAANARAMYDVGTAVYTAAQDIVYDFTFNIGTTFYKAIFLADGSAVQVQISNGTVTSMASASTFTVTPTLPYCAQYGNSGIVIVAVNGYWAWDGALYSAGAFAPAWLSGVALLTPVGTTHTSTTVDGVSPTTNIVNGMAITDVTHADIPANTTITAGAGTASLTISNAATGSHTGDTMHIGWAMPSGLSGTAVETYAGHVWIINGNTCTFSAPGNGANFSTSQGGGSFTSSDGFLRTAFVNLKQSNGFLYLFGDGSINVISNVQTSGSPATTTFNNQNVDPQTGLGFRDSLAAFGRALIFCATDGVYALFGGAAEKISNKLDKLFQKANFVALVPTACIIDLFSVQTYCMAMNTLDPTTGVQRDIMILWNGNRWFVASQTNECDFLTTVDQTGSQSHQGWANDKRHVFQMFVTPSGLQKKVSTKLWAGRSILTQKQSVAVYAETDDLSGLGVPLTGTIDSDTNAAVNFNLTAFLQFVNNSGQVISFFGNSTINFISDPPGVQGNSVDQSGRRLGVTLTSTGSDFFLLGVGVTYNENSYYGP